MRAKLSDASKAKKRYKKMKNKQDKRTGRSLIITKAKLKTAEMYLAN